jgi:hypothetical protein
MTSRNVHVAMTSGSMHVAIINGMFAVFTNDKVKHFIVKNFILIIYAY